MPYNSARSELGPVSCKGSLKAWLGEENVVILLNKDNYHYMSIGEIATSLE